MKTKMSIIIVLLGFMIIPSIQSCQKYADGPSISLRTRTERVANNWKVENYKINGSDYTSLVASYTESFSKSGSYSYDWGSINGEGTWKFINNDEEIQLTGNDGQSSRKLFIMKLEEKTFWYYYMDGNDKHELHLVAN